MADLFLNSDVRKLLENKSVVFLGDSNSRAMYKDLLMLSSNNTLLSEAALKSKQEMSFCGDVVVRTSEGHNGRDYFQERLADRGGPSAPVMRFYFITQCYSDYVVANLKQNSNADVIVFNSCLWDITRWGSNGVNKFKENLLKLMTLAREVLSPDCLFIWCTTLPLSQRMRGGFLVKQVEFLKHTLRFDVAEANLYATKVVSQAGFDVLDLHYYFRHQIHRRANDGIHWSSHTVRHMTNLLLTHIALAWDRQLPDRFQSINLDSIVQMEDNDHDDDELQCKSGDGSRANGQRLRTPLLQMFYDREGKPSKSIFNPYDGHAVTGRSLFYTDFTSDIVEPVDMVTPFFTASQQTLPPIRQHPPPGSNYNNNNYNPFNAVSMAHEKRGERKRFQGQRFNRTGRIGRRPRGGGAARR